MSKTFTYTRQCGSSSYSEQTDENFCAEEDFDYVVDREDVRSACAELSFGDFFVKGLSQITAIKDNEELQKELRRVIEQGIQTFISELDIDDQAEEYFDEALKEYFREDAMSSWGEY